MSRQFDPAPSPSILPDGTIIPAYVGPGVDKFVKNFGRDDLLEYSVSTRRSSCDIHQLLISEQILD